MIERRFIRTPAGRLEVLESAGSGPHVFLCHGNSGSAEDFTAWLEGELGRRCKLVAVSLPGHGGSDPAENAIQTYSIAGYGDAVAEVVTAFDCSRYWLVGQSLGGHVLLESLGLMSGARGLMLLSAPPISPATLAAAFKPDPTGGALFAGDLSALQLEKFVASLVNKTAGPLADRVRRNILRTDSRARECLGRNLAALRDERQQFEQAGIPIAVVAAAQDAFLQGDYYATLPRTRMWGGAPIVFEDRPHALHLEAAPELMRIASEFIGQPS